MIDVLNNNNYSIIVHYNYNNNFIYIKLNKYYK